MTDNPARRGKPRQGGTSTLDAVRGFEERGKSEQKVSESPQKDTSSPSLDRAMYGVDLGENKGKVPSDQKKKEEDIEKTINYYEALQDEFREKASVTYKANSKAEGAEYSLKKKCDSYAEKVAKLSIYDREIFCKQYIANNIKDDLSKKRYEGVDITIIEDHYKETLEKEINLLFDNIYKTESEIKKQKKDIINCDNSLSSNWGRYVTAVKGQLSFIRKGDDSIDRQEIKQINERCDYLFETIDMPIRDIKEKIFRVREELYKFKAFATFLWRLEFTRIETINVEEVFTVPRNRQEFPNDDRFTHLKKQADDLFSILEEEQLGDVHDRAIYAWNDLIKKDIYVIASYKNYVEAIEKYSDIFVEVRDLIQRTRIFRGETQNKEYIEEVRESIGALKSKWKDFCENYPLFYSDAVHHALVYPVELLSRHFKNIKSNVRDQSKWDENYAVYLPMLVAGELNLEHDEMSRETKFEKSVARVEFVINAKLPKNGDNRYDMQEYVERVFKKI